MKPPWPPMLAATLMLLLAGCTVAPHHQRSYGYGGHGYGGYGSPYHDRGAIIVMPAPRIEHRGPPPGPGHVWIGGYWNRIGARHDWVPGYWAPPARHPRPPIHPQWQPGRDRIEHDRGDRGREPPRLRPPPKPRIDHGTRPDRPPAPGFGENRRPSFEARKGERGTRAQPESRRGKDDRGRPDRQRPSLHIDRR